MSTSPRRFPFARGALTLSLLLASCAQQKETRGPSTPATPAMPAAAEPVETRVLERASSDAREAPDNELAALDAAERELHRVLGGAAVGGKGEGAEETESQKKDAPARAERKPADAPPPSKERRRAGTTHACASACSALASMDRSAARVCVLVGDGDARCQTARSRLRSAEELVQASCPQCRK